jgi:hypothetical protein
MRDASPKDIIAATGKPHPSIASTQEKSPSPATRVDVPMLVLRGEMAEASGFPIGAKAFLSTNKRDITLTRMGLAQPRKLRVAKTKS